MGREFLFVCLFHTKKGFLAWGSPAAAAVNIRAMGLFFLTGSERGNSVIHYQKEREGKEGGRGGGGRAERKKETSDC